MYSYADRLRAVELYLKLGKRVKATIRQLGYPAKIALKNWCREYEQHLDVRARSVARAPKYPEAEKQAALPQALMTSSYQLCECMLPSCRGLVAC
ncbi:integrase catalytic region [Rhizobium sp. Pop5]|nr:integrase catalytic region [Rhizobium sp. Pop5]